MIKTYKQKSLEHKIRFSNVLIFLYWFIDFTLEDQSLTEFTNPFSPNNFKNGLTQFIEGHNIYPSWNDQQFRLNKISKVKVILERLKKDN